MINERERLEQAKARLAQKPELRHRPQTIIGLVRDLEVEIRQARARGKLWSDIANDLAGDEAIRPDSVRLAFSRLQSRSMSMRATPKTKRKSSKHTIGTACSEQNSASSTGSSKFEGLFAPMFDAKDALGRNREEKGL
jgi:hypothetical protein